MSQHGRERTVLLKQVLGNFPEVLPLRKKMQDALAALQRAGVTEAVDVAFLADVDVTEVANSEDVTMVIKLARGAAVGTRDEWTSAAIDGGGAGPGMSPVVPRQLFPSPAAATTSMGRTAEASLAGLAVLGAFDVAQHDPIPTTSSYAAVEQEQLDSFLRKAETFIVVRCVGCPRHCEMVDGRGGISDVDRLVLHRAFRSRSKRFVFYQDEVDRGWQSRG